MPKVVKELVTKWTYKVNTKDVDKAKKSVMGLKKSLSEVKMTSQNFSKNETARLRRVRDGWKNLNSEVRKYRRNTIGGGGSFFGRGGGGDRSKKGRRGSVSGPNPFAFVGGQVLGSGLATSLFHAGSAAPALAAGAAAGVGLIKSVNLAAAREQAQFTLSALLKSDQAANNLLNRLNKFGELTPFDIPTLRELARTMLATQFHVDEIIPTLRMMGNLTNGNNVILKRMIINLGQIRGNAVLSTRDLREFATAGIPLAAELAKNLGVTRDVLSDMVTKRKVKFTDVMKAIKTLTTGGGQFAGIMERIQRSFSGAKGQFFDSLVVLGETLGMGVLPILDKGLRALTVMIKGLTSTLQDAGTVIKAVFGPAMELVIRYMEWFFSKEGVWENKWFRLLNPLTAFLDILEDLAMFIEGDGKSLIGHFVDKIKNADFGALFKGMFDGLKNEAKEMVDTPFFGLMEKMLDKIPNFIGASVAPAGGNTSLASNANFNQSVNIGLQQGVSTNEALDMMNKSGETLLDSLNHRLQPNSVA